MFTTFTEMIIINNYSPKWRLITSELANQRARKVLFTCVVYTNDNNLYLNNKLYLTLKMYTKFTEMIITMIFFVIN